MENTCDILRCGTGNDSPNSNLFLILKTKSNENLSMMTIDTIQRKLIIDDSADKENNGI